MKSTSTTLTLFLTATLVTSACEKKNEKAPTKAEPSKPAPAAKNAPVLADPAKKVPAKVEPTKKPTVGEPKRLAGTEDPETMCKWNEILLTMHSYTDLANGKYCDLCKSYDEMACELDWPSSDVMECREYDVMRNGIYAVYGHVFKKEVWQKEFATRPWYKASGSVDGLTMPVVAQKNVTYLMQAQKRCQKILGR